MLYNSLLFHEVDVIAMAINKVEIATIDINLFFFILLTYLTFVLILIRVYHFNERKYYL